MGVDRITIVIPIDEEDYVGVPRFRLQKRLMDDEVGVA